MAPQSSAGVLVRAREVVAREAQAVRALSDQLDRPVGILNLLLARRGRVLVAGVGASRAVARRPVR